MSTIYEVLRKDHRKLEGLLHELVMIRNDGERRGQLLNEIRDELVPHSRAEEAVLYNSLRTVPVVADEAWHGIREHMSAEAMLRALQVADKVDANFHQLAMSFKEAITHHIKEEEEELFTLAKGVVTPEEAEQMATVFSTLKEKVQKQNLLGTTLDMIANMMPPRLSRSFREHGHKTLFTESERAA